MTGSATTARHLARERARDEEEPCPGGKVKACGEKQGFPEEMEEWVGWGRAEIIGVKDDSDSARGGKGETAGKLQPLSPIIIGIGCLWNRVKMITIWKYDKKKKIKLLTIYNYNKISKKIQYGKKKTLK